MTNENYSFVDSDVGTTEKITYNDAVDIIRSLSGKIFTQLDACITNDRQLKSIKDCIRNDIAYAYSELYKIAEPGFDPDKLEPVDENQIEEVSLEEAVGV